MTLRDELDTLASAICKKAINEATPLNESTDALKAATAYYAVREKVKLKSGDDDGGNVADFNQFSGAIRGAGNQEPTDGRPAQPPASRRRVS